MSPHRGWKTTPVERQTSGTLCPPSSDMNIFQAGQICEYVSCLVYLMLPVWGLSMYLNLQTIPHRFRGWHAQISRQTQSNRWKRLRLPEKHTYTGTAGISCSLRWRHRLNPSRVIWGPQSKLPQWGCRDHTHIYTHICTHTINRALFLCIPPSLHPSFSPHLQIISSHMLLKLPCLWAIKWQTRSNYCNVITRTPCFLSSLSPPPNHISLSPHFLFPRGSKWGQIFPFLLCDLIRAMTLVAAYRAGRRFLTKSSLLHNASSFIFPFIPLPNNVFWCCHVWASRGMCIQMWIRMSLNLQAARICRLSTVWFTRTSS